MKCPLMERMFTVTDKDSRRLDIQGVRALSILSVLLFHFLPFATPNGYLGVDVFFVISGYLMSLILMKEEAITTSVVYTFYYRRIKRIMPLYYLVFGITALASVYFMGVAWITDNMASFQFALYYKLNIFQQDRQSYFRAVADNFNIFLHGWSLSVEMQFYLFVPILFFFFLNVFNKNERSILVTILIVSLASFYFAIYQLIYLREESTYFYHPFSRVWEFMAGILAQQISSKHKKKGIPLDIPKALAASVCFCLLLVLFFPLPLDAYPIRMYIVAVAACQLCLGSYCTGCALANPVMQYIGGLSYSLYLVHWPILVLFKYHQINVGIALLLSILISIVLHHGFEKVYHRLQYYLILPLIALLAGLCVLLLFNWRGIHEQYMANVKLVNANLELLNGKFHFEDAQYSQYGSYRIRPPFGFAEFPPGNGTAIILVVGNSYATQQVQIIRNLIGNNYARLVMYTAPGNQVIYTYDAALTDTTRDLVFDVKPNLLIVLERYLLDELATYTDYDSVLIEYLENIEYYQMYADHILIESPHPMYDLNFLNSFITKLERNESVAELNVNLKEAQKKIEHTWLRISAMMHRCAQCQILHSDTPFIDESSGVVRTYDNKTMMSYVDNTIHLTKYGLDLVEKSYAKVIGPLMKKYA